MRYLFNKSLIASRDIKKGSKISLKDLKDVKPNIGISATNFEKIIGRKTKKNLKKGSFFDFKDFN